MRTTPAAAAGVLLATCALCPNSIAANRDTEIDVVVDFTDAGRRIPHPTSDDPAYYYPVLWGFEELGAPVAGERHPKAGDVGHAVAVELARQGYLEMKPAPFVNRAGQVTFRDGTVVMVPASPGRGRGLDAGGAVPLTLSMLEAPSGPYSLKAAGAGGPNPAMEALRAVDPVHGPVMSGTPSLIIFIQEGYIYPEFESTAPVFGPKGQTELPPASFFSNQSQMLGLVGGSDFKSEYALFGGAEIYQRAQLNRYFLMLNAYDFQAYQESRRLVLLWQAKMSCPSDGVVQFADVLDGLVAAGGPYFGRETTGPRFLVAPVTPEGRVEIGEMREVNP